MFFNTRFYKIFPVFLLITFMLIFSGCGKDNATDSGKAPDTKKDIEKLEENVKKGINPDRDYLILVNQDNKYDFGGEYDKALQPDIIYASDCDGEPTPIEKGTNSALSLLKQHLRDVEGVDIELYSAYRTKEDQQWVYDTYGNLKDWSETNTVFKPGFSEHHTGLLVNIVVWRPDEENPDEYIWTTETAERQKKYPAFKVIHENLADYGFIDRYPAGKEDITGSMCEPYEIRFVGSPKIAHEIMDNGLCLEEYLENNK